MNLTQFGFPAQRRRIYLLRHGDVTYFDPEGRPLRPDQVPLNEEGRRQALATAQVLAPIPLDRVLASDLPRSVETARLVVGDRPMPIETHASLREIQPGRLADIPRSNVAETFLGAFRGNIGRETQFLAGETFGSLSDRVQSCLATLLADAHWRHLLIVAHGGVNRVVLAQALGLGLSQFGALEQDPGCLNILDVDERGQWIVRLMNHTCYNPAKVGIQWTTMEGLFLQYARGQQPT